MTSTTLPCSPVSLCSLPSWLADPTPRGTCSTKGDALHSSMFAHSRDAHNACRHIIAPRPPNGTTATTASPGGTDPFLGPYDEIILPAGKAGNFAVRWFTELDTFLFDRRPAPQSPDVLPAAAPPANTPVLDRTFPTFDDLGPVLGGNQSVSCMGWSNHYFYPGGVADSVASCQSDGPVNAHGPHPLQPIWIPLSN